MEITMYDTLLQLPLFQGLGRMDLTNILSKVKLSFHKFEPDEVIVRQGDKCEQLLFFLSGELLAETNHFDPSYVYTEVYKKPAVIEPYSVFGLHPNFLSTYKARTKVKMLMIEKKYSLTELNNYEIFHINYLNILSNQVQIEHKKINKVYASGVHNKIVQFFLIQARKTDGEKNIKIKMEDLAALIDETRINVSRELNDMNDRGLIELGRKSIFIPALEKLSTSIQTTKE